MVERERSSPFFHEIERHMPLRSFINVSNFSMSCQQQRAGEMRGLVLTRPSIFSEKLSTFSVPLLSTTFKIWLFFVFLSFFRLALRADGCGTHHTW